MSYFRHDATGLFLHCAAFRRVLWARERLLLSCVRCLTLPPRWLRTTGRLYIRPSQMLELLLVGAETVSLLFYSSFSWSSPRVRYSVAMASLSAAVPALGAGPELRRIDLHARSEHRSAAEYHRAGWRRSRCCALPCALCAMLLRRMRFLPAAGPAAVGSCCGYRSAR